MGQTVSTEGLMKALRETRNKYSEAVDKLREQDHADVEIQQAVWSLRECTYLVHCLSRLVEGRTVDELHTAFGAPGDFGYDTPIGDALSRLYRGES